MSKPFTADDLAHQLAKDITWRIKEISDLKYAVRSGDKFSRPALLRALVTISYAHWEGHIKFAAQRYLTHVSLRKMPFTELSRQFFRNDLFPKMGHLSQQNMYDKNRLVDEILDGLGRRFSKVNENLINTKSNLNFDVLCDICTVCGIDEKIFADHQNFIDVILLKRRNSIAHGEDTFVDVADLDPLTDQTISLMRMFSNDLQAKAHLGHYRVMP